MSLKIETATSPREVNPIAQNLGDIPGGMTLKPTNMGGEYVYAGSPLCRTYTSGSLDGMVEVVKTAEVQANYTSGTSIRVKKGHHFKVGDGIAQEGMTASDTITAIDKTTSTLYDTLTIAGTIGAAAAGIVLVQVTVDATVKHTAKAYGAVSSTSATTINVDKGHNIVVGDYLAGATDASDPMTGKLVTDINYNSSTLYDTITIGAANGKAIADDEILTTVKASNNSPATASNIKTYTEFAKTQGKAFGMAGSSCAVDSNEFIPVVVAGVVKEAACPPLTAAIKAELSTFNFV